MKDLISRQRAIDIVWKWFKKAEINGDICLDGLRQLPSEQPEIIRCRECAHYQTDWIPESVPNRHYCAIMDNMMPEDGYCYLAEPDKEGN